jgi:hypothetical protein
MIRPIAFALAALALLAGAASAHPDFFRIVSNGTHLDGMRAGIAGDAVGAVVLVTGTTVRER